MYHTLKFLPFKFDSRVSTKIIKTGQFEVPKGNFQVSQMSYTGCFWVDIGSATIDFLIESKIGQRLLIESSKFERKCLKT